MAYSPSEKYPGAVDSDPNYQGGKFRDNNPSTTNNGSPLKAIDRNELLARDEAIMNDAGFEYNGLPDTPQDSQMFRAYKASLGNGANLLSNHNFLIQTPDDSQPLPSSTPTSYPPGHQIFSGVFANETSGITNLTYIDGRVSFSGGDLYFAVPNTGAIARLSSDQLVASVADFDGKPRTRGVSFGLVGDEYRVTVGIDALEDSVGNETLLGSVKFEQGSVATGHDVATSLTSQNAAEFTEIKFNNIQDMIENHKDKGVTLQGHRCSTGSTTWKYLGTSFGDLSDFSSLTPISLTDFNFTAGALSVRNNIEDMKADTNLRHTINPSAVDEHSKLQAAIVAASSGECKIVEGRGLEIACNVDTNGSIKLYSDTTLDMQGGAIVRLGTSASKNVRQIENASYGTLPYDHNIRFYNCLIVGNGSIAGVSDQGAGLGFLKVEGAKVFGVDTDDTNGDGLQQRIGSAEWRDINVGSFGRNAFSPTSGIHHYKNVDLYGTPTPGANPGAGLDAEIDASTEVSEHYLDGVKCRDATFVDLSTSGSEGDPFSIKVKIQNSEFGPAFKPLRFYSNSPDSRGDITVDSSNKITSTNTGTPVTFRNVNGYLGSASISALAGGSNIPAITVEGIVRKLVVDKPRIDYSNIYYSLQSFGATLDDGDLEFAGDSTNIFIKGKDNNIEAPAFLNITLDGTETYGNRFISDTISIPNNIIESNGAQASRNTFVNIAKENAQNFPYFSKQFDVVSGPTSNIKIATPDTSVLGRVFKITILYSYRGDPLHYCAVESLVRSGQNGVFEVARPVEVLGGSTTLVNSTFTTTELNYTLGHQYAGTVTVVIT